SGYDRSGAALATLFGLALAAVVAWRAFRRRLVIEKPVDLRFGKALAGLSSLAVAALPAPVAIAAVIATLDAYALLPATIRQLALGLNLSVGVASFGRGIALGALAPESPWRRLPRMEDATAHLLHGHFLWAVRALAVAVFLNTVHRQVVAPPALTIATSAFMALAVALLLIHLLRRLRRPQDGGDAPAWSAPGLMAIGWIAAALILGALVAGYVGLASFIAERL